MLESLFATPLWSFSYPTRADLQPLADRVLELEQGNPAGIKVTNQGGWHSSTSLLDDPAFADLFRWVAACCQQAFEKAGWDLARAKPSFNNAWAMVNRRGNGTRAHLHPNSLFSGVFYLKVPPASGDIAFLDPRSGAQMLLPPLQSAKGVFNGRELRRPEEGLLLLFPAWLWHEVEPSESLEPRICISFNVGMRPLAVGKNQGV